MPKTLLFYNDWIFCDKVYKFSSATLLFLAGKLNNKQVMIGTKKIATVNTETPRSAEWLPKNLLISDSGW